MTRPVRQTIFARIAPSGGRWSYMRGLIIAGAIVLGPVVVVACVDGLATGPVGEEVGAVFDVLPRFKHAHACPPGFMDVFRGDPLFDSSVNRNENDKICSNGHTLVDDAGLRIRRKVKKK